MFFMPQQTISWVPAVAPVQAPMLNIVTALPAEAGLLQVPQGVAVVLLHGSDAPKSMGAALGTNIEMNIMGPIELSNAVWSLYEDQIKPYGRILKKRLAEMASDKGFGHVELDSSKLRQACESYAWFDVKDESAGEWVCLLPGMPETFIDATNPTDLYPAHLWASFAAYLDSLAKGNAGNPRMPGGRVACAQECASRQLHFFSDYRLGQICHIVQLAISQKHLLGYSDGCLVPYIMSQSKVKELRAAAQKSNGARGSRPLATWPKVREVLQNVLWSCSMDNEPSVPLSNMKRIFRSQYKVELSETALGYAKLTELLRDPFVSDLCIVELQRNGYVMIPRPSSEASVIQEVNKENDSDNRNIEEVHPSPTASQSDSNISGKTQSSKRRPQTMMHLDDDVEPWDSACPESNMLSAFGQLIDWSLSPSKVSQASCVGGLLHRTFINIPPPPPTPAKSCGKAFPNGARDRSSSVPKDFGSTKFAFADALHSLVYLHRPVHSAPVSPLLDSAVLPSRER